MGDMGLWFRITGFFYDTLACILPRRLVLTTVHKYFSEKADMLGVDDYFELKFIDAYNAKPQNSSEE